MPRETDDGVPLIEGREYEVLTTARLHGMTASPKFRNTWDGWKQDLNPGDRLIYTGHRMGWGSDSIPTHQWSSDQSRADRASFVEFHPTSGSMYDTRPAAGTIRLIEELTVTREEAP